ncbi:hypothetical protein T492DRAFT_440477 [Pavlovales sp. CCMP2436]|nr:hypothetical protein T492DRAFT_440477 [Pavlovales sp. CCMP2436]
MKRQRHAIPAGVRPCSRCRPTGGGLRKPTCCRAAPHCRRGSKKGSGSPPWVWAGTRACRGGRTGSGRPACCCPPRPAQTTRRPPTGRGQSRPARRASGVRRCSRAWAAGACSPPADRSPTRRRRRATRRPTCSPSRPGPCRGPPNLRPDPSPALPGPPTGLAAEPVLPPRCGCRASLAERTSPPLIVRGPVAHLGGGGDALAPGGPRGAAGLGAYDPPALSQWGGGAWPAGSRLPALPDAPGLGGGALTGAVGLSRLSSSDLACLFAPDLPGLGGAGRLAGGPAGVAAAARIRARASSKELPAFFLTGLSRSREDPAFGAIKAEALGRPPPSRSDT